MEFGPFREFSLARGVLFLDFANFGTLILI